MYQMSSAILALGHCQASSIKIHSDRLLSGGGGDSVGLRDGEEDDGLLLRQKEQGNIYSRVCHNNAVISPPNCALVSSIITFTKCLHGYFILLLNLKEHFIQTFFFSLFLFT